MKYYIEKLTIKVCIFQPFKNESITAKIMFAKKTEQRTMFLNTCKKYIIRDGDGEGGTLFHKKTAVHDEI